MMKGNAFQQKRQQKRVPPVGIRLRFNRESRNFYGTRGSSEHIHAERKGSFVVMCVNRHNYKTDVKPPAHCPVCNVVVDRRGYV